MRWRSRGRVRAAATLALGCFLGNACGAETAQLDGNGGATSDAGADENIAHADAADSADLGDVDAADSGNPDADVEASPACAPETTEFGAWTFDQAFTANATSLYFTVSSGAQTIVKTRLKAGGPITDFLVLDTAVSALAATGSAVYVLTRGSATEDGTLMAAPIPSGVASTLASAPAPLESLAIDATHAYVTRRDDAGALLRVPRDGGSFETLADGLAKPWHVALSANAIFWLSWDNDMTLSTLPKSGGTPSVIASGVGRFGIDETSIYYSNGNYVKVLALSGGTPWTLAPGWPYGIFPFEEAVYLKEQCSISKFPKSGGLVKSVAGADPCSDGDESFAADEACVYFMHGVSSVGPDGGYVWTGYLDRFPR